MSVCKRTLYFFLLFCLVVMAEDGGAADTDILISEIMYDLSGIDGGHEWIELYNKGASGVDLTGWRFEEGGTQHTLSLREGSMTISAGAYTVIADDGDQFLLDYSSFSGNLIDSSFSLSNTGESLILRNGYNGTIIDTVIYSSSWGADGDGNSLEKINPSGGNTSSNWDAGTRAGGTPGEQNSIYDIPHNHNLTISSSDISFNPSGPTPGSNVTVTATIHNAGTEQETNVEVGFHNGDPDGSGSLINTDTITNISGGAGANASIVWNSVAEGSYTVYVKVILATDEDNSDNKTSKELTVSDLPEVVINEFLAAPKTAYSQEWIELYNKENTSLDLGNWQLDDIEGGTSPYTLPEGTTIESEGFLVFTRTFGLNNDGDTVRLLNSTGTLVDSHSYSGISYDLSEGRVPDGGETWTTFATPTPGAANSNNPPEIADVQRSPLYPGAGDRVKISCEVEDSDLSSVTLKYSTGGDYLEVTMNLENEKYRGEIPSQGEGSKVNYYVEVRDQGGQTSTSATYFYRVGVEPRVVINEFLPDPSSDWNGDGRVDSNDEWIELYNKESEAVDISNWILDDLESGGTEPYPIGTTIPSGGFLTFHKSETGVGLNNGGDTVRLLDSAGDLVDSYAYSSSSDDISQGRVPDGGNNWAFLDNPTPGTANPAALATVSSGEVVISEIMYDPLSNDYDCEWIELYNKEDKAVNLKSWILEGKEIREIIIGARSYLVITDDLLDEDRDGYSFEKDWGDGSDSWGNYSGEDFAVIGMSISLSNKEDKIVLADGSRETDVLTYEDSWGGGKGISLERKNLNLANTQANWGSSQDERGATPGQPNSLSGIEGSGSKAVLLINEINFKISPHWVEIYCKDDANQGKGVNLAGYYLTDLDNPDKTFQDCTIKTGEYLLLRYGSEAEDETSSGEGNENGIIDLWTSVSRITSTDEQMVLYGPAQKIVDAACWSDQELSDSESRDLEEIYEAGEWEGKTADFCINSKEMSRKKTIARGNFSDTNSKRDWTISFPTPGWDNSDLERGDRPVEVLSFNIIPRVFFPRGDKNPQTTSISFTLSKEAEVTLRIYDVRGRLIKVLLDQEPLTPGITEAVWEGRDGQGDIVSIGIYIVYIEALCSQGNDTKKSTVVAAKKLD